MYLLFFHLYFIFHIRIEPPFIILDISNKSGLWFLSLYNFTGDNLPSPKYDIKILYFL